MELSPHTLTTLVTCHTHTHTHTLTILVTHKAWLAPNQVGRWSAYVESEGMVLETSQQNVVLEFGGHPGMCVMVLLI